MTTNKDAIDEAIEILEKKKSFYDHKTQTYADFEFCIGAINLYARKNVGCESCEFTGTVQIEPDSEIMHPCDTCQPLACKIWMDGFSKSKQNALQTQAELVEALKEARKIIHEHRIFTIGQRFETDKEQSELISKIDKALYNAEKESGE